MNSHSATRLCARSIMGTDLDAALDEVFYGRHNRHDGGIPASLGSRTSYDIKYAHQRLLRKKEREQQAFENPKRERQLQGRYNTVTEGWEMTSRRGRRQDHAASDMVLWQKEGWEPWWNLLRLAARNPRIQAADRDELVLEADLARYELLKALLVQLAAEWGFSRNMAVAVAASIYCRGIPDRHNLDAREEHIRRYGSVF